MGGFQNVVIAVVLFVGLDVETANASRASICQIGLVECRRGGPVTRWRVNPRGPFDQRNIAVHGITPADVAGAPDFAGVYPALRARIGGRLVVAHSQFDAQALAQAIAQAGAEPIDTEWIDTVAVARVAWPHLGGHSLGAVAAHLGHRFAHHDAGDDAVMACLILLRAMRETGRGLDHWRDVAGFSCRLGEGVTQRPPPAAYAERVARASAGDGVLAGHCLCITGETALAKRRFFQAMVRRSAGVVMPVWLTPQDVQNALDLMRTFCTDAAMNMISELRALLACSQSDIGRLLGLHRVSVNRMESGQQRIAGPSLILLERYLQEARANPSRHLSEIAAGPISPDPDGAAAGEGDVPPGPSPAAGSPVSPVLSPAPMRPMPPDSAPAPAAAAPVVRVS